MQLDYATLEMQRRQHPAWRLLAADSAPLVASFLHRVFVVPNVRVPAPETGCLSLRLSPRPSFLTT